MRIKNEVDAHLDDDDDADKRKWRMASTQGTVQRLHSRGEGVCVVVVVAVVAVVAVVVVAVVDVVSQASVWEI